MKFSSTMKTKIPNLKFPQWKFKTHAENFFREEKSISEALNSFLDENQKSFRERTFYGAFSFLKRFIELAEKLNEFTNKEKDGIKAAIHAHAGDFPNTYLRKGTPMASQIIVEFKNGKWNVLSFARVPVPKTEIKIINLPEKAREKLIKNFCNF